MREGGVQKQGSLGFQPPKETEALLGRSVQAALEAQEQQVRTLATALEEERTEHRGTAEALATRTDDAIALYAALKTVVAWVRDDQAEDGVDDLPTDVATAAEILVTRAEYDQQEEPSLVEDEDGAPLPWCPECVQGKHQNCTVDVITDDDKIVNCGCHAGGHR